MNQNQPKYRHTRYTTIILAALVIFSIFFENYAVHSSENLTDELVETKFVLGWEPNEHSIQSAITFKLSDGWKTYWRNPGEYGIAPTFDWRKSTNIREIKVSWPTPKLFDQNGVSVLGYDKTLILPIEIVRKDSSQPVTLNMEVSFGICSDICVLKTFNIFKIIGKLENNSPHGLIEKAVKSLTKKYPQEDIFSISCKIFWDQDDLLLSYNIKFLQPMISKPIVIFEYLPDQILFKNKNSNASGKSFTQQVSLKSIINREGVIERERINALFVYNKTSFEVKGCN